MKDLEALQVGRGRPREFDIDNALAAALAVFWRLGYEGASMTDLTQAMGMGKPSVYATFGNKEALFQKALDLYEREKLAYMTLALTAPTARGVANRLLCGALDMQLSPQNPKGCLGVTAMTACGVEADSIKAEVIKRRGAAEAALINRFERAVIDGDFPENYTPTALARFLFSLLQALAIQGGSGATTKELADLVETSMAVWPTK